MSLFVLRKAGKILRGTVGPYQIIGAAALGGMLGFMPGFAEAPGLIVLLVFLLVVLNVNLFLAAVVGSVSALLSYLLLPVSFHVGRALLDGPLQGFFVWLINAPVTALFGLETYVTTGGLVVGFVLGVAVGLGVVRFVNTLHHWQANMEKGSPKYQALMSKKWVKATTWVLFGPGKQEADAEKPPARSRLKPLRPLGLAFVGVLAVFLFVASLFFKEPIVTWAVQSGLERANGATVDLEGAQLDLRQGRLAIRGLAMADPNALDTDLFRAAHLDAEISGLSLWRKRVIIDRIAVAEASHGQQRRVPGRLVGPPLQPDPETPPLHEGEKSLEDYIENALEWKERLRQLRQWLDVLSGPAPDASEEDPEQPAETLRERLARRAEMMGYRSVKAGHLVVDQPAFHIREIQVDGVTVAQLPDELLRIESSNLSSHPHLLEEGPRIKVDSTSGKLGFDLVLGSAASKPTRNHARFFWQDLPADTLMARLRITDEPPLKGGFVDVEADGILGGGYTDLPIRFTVRNSNLTLPGVGSTDISNLSVPVTIRGSLDNPRVAVDERAVRDALARAGADRLLDRVRERTDDLPSDAGRILDRFSR